MLSHLPHIYTPLSSDGSVSGFVSVKGRWEKRGWQRKKHGRDANCKMLLSSRNCHSDSVPLGPKWLGLCPLWGWMSGLCISASLSHHSSCYQLGVMVTSAGPHSWRPGRSQKLVLSTDLTSGGWAVTSTRFTSLSWHFPILNFSFSSLSVFSTFHYTGFPLCYVVWLLMVLCFFFSLKGAGSARCLCRVEEAPWDKWLLIIK